MVQVSYEWLFEPGQFYSFWSMCRVSIVMQILFPCGLSVRTLIISAFVRGHLTVLCDGLWLTLSVLLSQCLIMKSNKPWYLHLFHFCAPLNQMLLLCRNCTHSVWCNFKYISNFLLYHVMKIIYRDCCIISGYKKT